MVLRAPMTNRQMDILRLLAVGKTNRQIGKHLDIAENTVRVHLSAIFKFLGSRRAPRRCSWRCATGW
ncbi:MAG: LuxR C-terminal-related transcriptional regulator [Pseudomonadota bacterium]|nr:LuxR C-terminal-related transcriptional regulator [Pseudomonadota bacterium]